MSKFDQNGLNCFIATRYSPDLRTDCPALKMWWAGVSESEDAPSADVESALS